MWAVHLHRYAPNDLYPLISAKSIYRPVAQGSQQMIRIGRPIRPPHRPPHAADGSASNDRNWPPGRGCGRPRSICSPCPSRSTPWHPSGKPHRGMRRCLGTVLILHRLGASQVMPWRPNWIGTEPRHGASHAVVDGVLEVQFPAHLALEPPPRRAIERLGERLHRPEERCSLPPGENELQLQRPDHAFSMDRGIIQIAAACTLLPSLNIY